MILVLLPPERARLAEAVLACGAVPVVDLTLGPAPVPRGAGVRVATPEGAPGDGPVLARAGLPLAGRACWKEQGDGADPGPGWAGIYLRGLGSGGFGGEREVEALLAEVDPAIPVLVDWPHPPEVDRPAATGFVLSDVLFALLEPGPGLRARLEHLAASDLRRLGGHTFVASLASPALRRLAAGAPFAEVAAGYFGADDAFLHAWPGGAGLLHARALARRHGSLAAALAAYGATAPRPVVTAADAPAVAAPTAAAEAVLERTDGEPIAIVGLGCRLPRAFSPARLWEGLVAGFDAVIEVPRERWDPALYWDPDRSAPDKTYAKIGAFITDFQFDPRRFRIPPASARLIDPIQQMALEAAADALDDAGLGPDKAFDRERCAVILGNSMGGEITNEYTLRILFPALRQALAEVPGFAALPADTRAQVLAAYEAAVKRDLPPITEDSMPGELANVVAGRIANALNLGGPNFTTDAACAGSMAAVQAAVKGLQDGDFDVAVTGGADRSMAPPTYIKFCKIGALSPDGSRPFDAGANGFVMGEGTGILVLKRLSDALRDGDRVYAVIRGVGASSDGRGKGITAPNPEGQKRALRRAYLAAGVDPADVDLFECHGTSTIVGDKVEVEALSDLVGDGARRARGAARIGSIKSNLGHLKAAAGAASLLKAALALHHRVLPPSIHYQTPRKDLPLDRVPLQVQTRAEAWETDRARFVGVSAFGFGGTNFHLVLEGTDTARPSRRGPPPPRPSVVEVPAERAAPTAEAIATPAAPPAPATVRGAEPERPSSAVPVPAGLWALSADSPEELIAKARALKRGHITPFEPDAPLRCVAAAANERERDDQVERVIAAVQKGKGYELVRARGIALEDVPCDGQLAFLFTGQGSQYIDMGLDLAEAYPVVAETFREADAVMTPILGRPLTAYIRRDPTLTEEEQFDRLRATEISQPATLTVDVAILRLFAAFGVQPDMVAGHSLGEYGAAVAAGMLDFTDALRAVSARGREMAGVQLDDFGKMAGIATSVENVEAVLAEIPGYVIAANKNCPTQTVIAGESDAVDAATEAFRSRGITVYPLPVSHAFHSRIVAPASEPLRRVLEGLDLREPRRRITTNVDSRYYPTGPGAREKAIDTLARQVASPVEWIAQIERMYADGARIFVECGPKRALTGFVVSILKHRPHRALYTNQPKRGGVLAFRDALASLLALGFPVRGEPGPADLFAPVGERRSTTPKLQARARTRAEREDGGLGGAPGIEREILRMVSQRTGYPPEALDLDFELESDLGIDTVKQADLIAAVRDHFQMEPDPAFRMGEHRTLRSLIHYASQRLGAARPVGVPARRPAQPEAEALTPTLPADALTQFLAEVAQKDLRGLDAARFAEAMLPALQRFLGAAWGAFQASIGAPVPAPAGEVPKAPPVPVPTAAPAVPAPAGPPAWPEIVCSGAALGLPAGEEVFAPDNVRRILRGENRIVPVPLPLRERLVDKGLVRLVKNPQTGEGEFVPVDSPEQVIRLAGIKARFDLAGDYGVDPALVRSLDITTQLAFAAGLEALRDAGIPLIRTFRTTSTGKSMATGWALPPSMRDTTGIVFASAFPGYDQLIEKLRTNGDDGEGRFDRRFLFQILAMGHSQFAQFVGARGPNTQINAACASTTQALAIAQDWIRVGRCERVIVLGADDVTNPNLIEWIGAGFLAAGAATTEARVEDAALPFDRRRHGMILGMGAVALVLETAAAARARGVTPIARLLATRISNSAFHGTRLDPEHISSEVKAFVRETLAAAGVDAESFARRCVFLSHETYTPARGGSAAAEMASLPAAFGPVASKILIANTKGFTGHAMGAGIEDAVAVKALEYQEVPPIANLKEPDPDLGDLTLSRGGPAAVDYALRLAAGFGSQLALASWQRVADSDRRVDGAAHAAWLAAEVGPGREVVEHRQLRYIPEAAQETPAHPPAAVVDRAEALRELIATIARKTGYAIEEVDPAYELEADLGIDTVKQAEIFGEVRERYGLARDDGFRLADYPTVEKLAGWLADRVAARSGAPASPAPVPVPASPEAPPAVSPVAASVAVLESPAADPDATPGAVLDHLRSVIARRTGYAVDEIDPAYELEADLGIDTVKQAEIFSEVREHYGLARDDNFRLADYPTVEKLAGWLADRAAARPASADAPPVSPPASPEAAPAAPPPSRLESPPSRSLAPLPPTVRIRRPVFVARPLTARLPLAGRTVRVLGEGPLAAAVAEGAVRRGARLAEAAEVVIDVGAPVLEGFRVARALNASPPARWLAVSVDGGDLAARRDAGARAGLAKALGREWTGCRAAVLELAEADAEAVLDEAEAADGALEARVDGGRRVGLLALVPEPLEPLREGGVALLTGGTRGITARVARSLATTARWTLVLAARSRPGDIPLDEEQARATIRARLGADGARVTPRNIEDALKPLRVAEEARRTVEELRALGAAVEVETVDLADTHAVRALVARLVDRFGGIDLCVHGAGVEESRLLADKDEAAFHRVYDGKAIGGLALAEALPASTWFVSMGSVAGRLGNPGQVDYAAANEAMARVCRARPRSLHIAWTAWADTGMAVRGGMDKLLGERGVELLPAEPGADLVQALVRAGVEGEVLVAGRLGDFPIPAPHPLLDHARFDGAAVVATRTLALATHPWLADHAIHGVPVLPGVMGLEWMAAAAWIAAPGDRVHGFADVRFTAPCKLHRDEPVELEIRAEPGPDGVRCTLSSTRTGRTGRVLRTEHFSALVRMTPAPLTPLRVPRLRDEPDDAGAIYRRFFHGPRFQVLRAADGMSVQGLRGAAEVRNGALAPGLLTDPLVLEAAFQLAGLHRMKREGVMSLPSAVAAVERVRPVADGEPLALVATRRGEAYDIDVEGPAGAVLRVRGFVLIELGPLDPQDRWPLPEGGWPSVATGSVAEADELAEAERAWLSGRGTPRRVADRLAGQVAARRAVAALVDGPFEVRRQESGEPEVHGADVRVSLSHQDGEALAIARRGAPFGVDVETIAPRAPGFATTWFRETEHPLLTDDAALTRAWAAKEAALKALGTGMALSPLELELTRLDAEGAELVLHGEARVRGLTRGGTTARVRFGDFGAGRVVAVAHLLADCADATHRRAG